MWILVDIYLEIGTCLEDTVFIRYGKGTTEHIARSKKDLNLIKFRNYIKKED